MVTKLTTTSVYGTVRKGANKAYTQSLTRNRTKHTKGCNTLELRNILKTDNKFSQTIVVPYGNQAVYAHYGPAECTTGTTCSNTYVQYGTTLDLSSSPCQPFRIVDDQRTRDINRVIRSFEQLNMTDRNKIVTQRPSMYHQVSKCC